MTFQKLSGAAIPSGAAVQFGADANHVIVTANEGDNPCGIALTGATGAGQTIQIATFDGVLAATAGAAITHGDWLSPAANGRLHLLSNGAGLHIVCGRALTDAAADGDPVTIEGTLFIREI